MGSHEELVSSVKASLAKQLEESHQKGIESMRAEVKVSASQALEEKMQQVLQESTQQHQVGVQHITSELNEKHSLELEKVRSDLMSLANSSQSEREQLVAAHREEMEREKAAASKRHASEVDHIVNELKSSHTKEMDIIAASKEKLAEKTEEKMKEVIESHEAQTKDLNFNISNLTETNKSLLAEQERIQSSFETQRCSLDEKVSILEGEIASIKISHEEQLDSVKKGINSEWHATNEKLTNDVGERSKALEKAQADLKIAEKKAAQASAGKQNQKS